MRWLPISKNTTFEEARDIVLNGNTAPDGANELALELLFDRCGGESAIQQNGRTYSPHFTVTSGDRSFDYSKESVSTVSRLRRS